MGNGGTETYVFVCRLSRVRIEQCLSVFEPFSGRVLTDTPHPCVRLVYTRKQPFMVCSPRGFQEVGPLEKICLFGREGLLSSDRHPRLVQQGVHLDPDFGAGSGGWVNGWVCGLIVGAGGYETHA